MHGICVFGDSIVLGRGDNKDRGWTGRLRKHFESQDYFNVLYNLGIPGDISPTLLERIGSECKARTVKHWPGDKFVIMVGIGTNDSRFLGKRDKPAVTPEDFKANIQRIIMIAKRYTPNVFFIGLTPVDEKLTNPFEDAIFLNERVKQFNDIVRDECKSNNIPFIDIFTELMKLDYPGLLGDGVHPNDKGYEKMYGIIRDVLISKGIMK